MMPKPRRDALEAEIRFARDQVASAVASFEAVSKYPPLSKVSS